MLGKRKLSHESCFATCHPMAKMKQATCRFDGCFYQMTLKLCSKHRYFRDGKRLLIEMDYNSMIWKYYLKHGVTIITPCLKYILQALWKDLCRLFISIIVDTCITQSYPSSQWSNWKPLKTPCCDLRPTFSNKFLKWTRWENTFPFQQGCTLLQPICFRHIETIQLICNSFYMASILTGIGWVLLWGLRTSVA